MCVCVCVCVYFTSAILTDTLKSEETIIFKYLFMDSHNMHIDINFYANLQGSGSY